MSHILDEQILDEIQKEQKCPKNRIFSCFGCSLQKNFNSISLFQKIIQKYPHHSKKTNFQDLFYRIFHHYILFLKNQKDWKKKKVKFLTSGDFHSFCENYEKQKYCCCFYFLETRKTEKSPLIRNLSLNCFFQSVHSPLLLDYLRSRKMTVELFVSFFWKPMLGDLHKYFIDAMKVFSVQEEGIHPCSYIPHKCLFAPHELSREWNEIIQLEDKKLYYISI